MANKRYIYLFIYLAPRLDLTVSFHHKHFIIPTSCPWVSEDEPREGLASRLHCIAKIPTGPTGKSGPSKKVDPFFRNFFGWTEPIHWVLDRNFQTFWLNGSRDFERLRDPCQSLFGPVNRAMNLLSFCRICRRVFSFLIGYILYGMGAWKDKYGVHINIRINRVLSRVINVPLTLRVT